MQRYRYTHPFSEIHKLHFRPAQSDTDKIFENHTSEFNGKKSLVGTIWSYESTNSALGAQDPITKDGMSYPGTIFPITPQVDGKSVWVTAGHCVQDKYKELKGYYGHNSNFIDSDDQLPLTRIPVTRTAGDFKCTTPKVITNVPDFGFVRFSEALPTDMRNSVIPVDHFWIPDPTALSIGTPVCFFGFPAKGGHTLEVTGAELVFTKFIKSASTGPVVKVTNDIVCYEAS